jgi:3',5'-cyclic AMP phosphodiesterase CpdA
MTPLETQPYSVTGDLVDHGEPEEYEQLRHLLARLSMPVFVIPGNHDAREPLREAFRGAGYLPVDGYLQYAIEDYPLRLVALDTLVPGKHVGMLCAERLGWLDATLAAQPDRPTVILMHHPPFATGITYMDNYGLDNAAGLAQIVARHPQVERIVCGHLHRAIDRRFAGRSLARRRARRTRSGSTSSPMRGSASSSSRPATSFMSGIRVAG